MLDFAKFVKYSKPGPRYTSYPTALEFSDAYGYDEYIKIFELDNKIGFGLWRLGNLVQDFRTRYIMK